MLLIEQIVPERNAPSFTKMLDLLMLTYAGGDLWLGPRRAVLDWNARALQTHRIARPAWR